MEQCKIKHDHILCYLNDINAPTHIQKNLCDFSSVLAYRLKYYLQNYRITRTYSMHEKP